MRVIFGLVLAGGRSRRFGREKAAVLLNGTPMLAHVVGRLRPSVARLAINARPIAGRAAWAAEHALPCLADRPGDPDGPLSGVRAGLAWAAAEGADLLATVPCDTPRLPADLVARLAAALTPATGAAVARTPSGPQPLCTLWRCDGLTAVEAVLTGGHPPMRLVLVGLSAVEVAFENPDAFAKHQHAEGTCAAGWRPRLAKRPPRMPAKRNPLTAPVKLARPLRQAPFAPRASRAPGCRRCRRPAWRGAAPHTPPR